MTARTAHGLDTPRGGHWADRAACGSPLVDPEWWWPMPGPSGPAAQLATHICRFHCPVRSACHLGAVENPPQHPCVQGGRRWVLHGARIVLSNRDEQTTALGCPYCAEEATC